jgi:hypothetical protein
MLEQAEKMLQFAGQVPSLQSKIDSVTENVNKMKFISPEDYVECESCGLLVNRVKAQVFSSVEWARCLSTCSSIVLLLNLLQQGGAY